MKKDCIQDFIEAWRQYDEISDPKVPSWNMRFRNAGYYCAELNGVEWNKCHEWCRENFGARNYAWVGSTFWFESEQDVIWFTLRWS